MKVPILHSKLAHAVDVYNDVKTTLANFYETLSWVEMKPRNHSVNRQGVCDWYYNSLVSWVCGEEFDTWWRYYVGEKCPV